jgi:glutamate-1-semialdehyde 2,1-aminomutase
MYSVSDQLARGMGEIFERAGVPHVIQHVGPMLSFFLMADKVETIREYRDVRRHCDFVKYIRLQHLMQKAGVYYHPNQFEPMFLSAVHSSEDIGVALDRLEQAVACLNA